MSHSSDINHDTSEPQSLAILVGIIITVLFIVGACVFSVFYFKETVTLELNAKDTTDPYLPLRQLRTYEVENLQLLEWKDKKSGRVKIPIDEAKRLVFLRYVAG